MIFLRVLVVVLLAAVASSALGYVFTRDRRYLRLAWRLLVAGLFAALVFFIVLIVERLTAPPPVATLPGTPSTRTAMVPYVTLDRGAERGRVGRSAQPLERVQSG